MNLFPPSRLLWNYLIDMPYEYQIVLGEDTNWFLINLNEKRRSKQFITPGTYIPSISLITLMINSRLLTSTKPIAISVEIAAPIVYM